MQQVLLLEGQPQRQQALSAVLSCLGCAVRTLSPAEFNNADCDRDVVLAIGGDEALDALLPVFEQSARLLPVLVFAAARPDFSVNYLFLGEFPCDIARLVDALHVAQRLVARGRAVAKPLTAVADDLVGCSEAMAQIRETLGRVADKDVSVLISGPSGAGKEVVARQIHRLSRRAEGPFVPLNCGAIPRDLLETELFGHEKGAFTGAISSREGRFEMARGGTLFLDEIGDMPLDMQVKLLRVLQEKRFERVGSNRSIETDTRIIAATHRDLEQLIAEGAFREDLYYRLNVFPIEVPALRERADDIPLLVAHLLAARDEPGPGVRFSSAALQSLCRYPWPGNVRELANLIERLGILHGGSIVGVEDLPEKFRDASLLDAPLPEAPSQPFGSIVLGAGGLDLKATLNAIEQSLIQQALELSGGIVARAAKLLHTQRTTLIEKMRKYGITG